MKNKKIKNFISSLLITTFVIPLPYINFIQKAEAQYFGGSYNTSGSYGSSGGSGGTNAGIGGYLAGIAPAITQLPLCKGKLNGVVKDIFTKSGAGELSAEAQKAYTEYTSQLTEDDTPLSEEEFAKTFQESKNKSESVFVFDEATFNKINEQDKKLNDIRRSQASLEVNDTCLKSIGRMIIKLMLQKITLSTVAWIQGGFDGNPAFIQNPESFFGDIAKNEILKFGLEIDDPVLYPFGKAFMRSQALAFNNHFAQNARYSLNELIANTTPQYTSIDFQADFSLGGWNAWRGLTTVPANNPLGFHMIASNELSKRLEGTYKSPANELRSALDQAAGFLGDQRCADPKGLTRAEHDQALAEKRPDLACQRWEYVTPGKMISEAATTALNYPNNNLLQAEDLNDAIAAVLDALLSKFSNDFINNGFANLSEQGSDGSYFISTTNLLDQNISEAEGDFTPLQLGGHWLQANPDFNIRTDLDQALIDEQRIYMDKITEQGKILKDLRKTIYQLDYCIPGPHPGWGETSVKVLDAVSNVIPSKGPSDFIDSSEEQIKGTVKTVGYLAGAAIGAAIGSAVAPFGTVIGAAIGFIIGLIVDLTSGESPEELVDIYYATLAREFTGIHFGVEFPSGIRSKHELMNVLTGILYLYAEKIEKHYTADFLPDIAPDAAVEFRKIPVYNQMIENNEDKAAVLNGIILRLNKVKEGVDELNKGLADGTINQAYYEEKLIPLINEFARLSSNMVTGDDIASVDHVSKSAMDEIKYVYDDLLTGPLGCEQELEKETVPAYLSSQYMTEKGRREYILRSTLRVPYPFPIWYDYNKYGPPANNSVHINADIDFPKTNKPFPTAPELGLDKYTDKTTSNKMPDYPKYLGPAFLPQTSFSTSGNIANVCAERGLYEWELDCINPSDLYRHADSWPVSVGRNTAKDREQGGLNEQRYRSFEQTIGIY